MIYYKYILNLANFGLKYGFCWISGPNMVRDVQGLGQIIVRDVP